MPGRIGLRITHATVVATLTLFLVASHIAVAGNSNGDGVTAGKAASAKKQVKKLKRTVASLEQRIAALEGKPSPSPSLPTTLPPSGPAGGELSGSYPNPTIGTVADLDVASSGDISFGNNIALFPDPTQPFTPFLRISSSVGVSGGLHGPFINAEQAQVSGTLDIFGHLRVPHSGTAGFPPPTNCDNAVEFGRLLYKLDANELWVCDDNLGGEWRQIGTA